MSTVGVSGVECPLLVSVVLSVHCWCQWCCVVCVDASDAVFPVDVSSVVCSLLMSAVLCSLLMSSVLCVAC